MAEPVEIQDYLRERRATIDQALDAHLPADTVRPTQIHEAMRYAVLGGGKRIRPIITLAAADACGATTDPLVKASCALELIHTYSLVHDDLPAMDDDDLRRGRKTTHVVYGEAIGILAGDALHTLAFEWLGAPIDGVEPAAQLRAVRTVARAIGASGMVGGQVADLEAENILAGNHDRDHLVGTLEFIHQNKTGRLLAAAAEIGGLLANAPETSLAALRTYGESIGLAFQIIDDLLDEEADSATLGKTAGKDLEQGKLTYPSLFGPDEARERASSLLDAAIVAAESLGSDRNYLAPLARYIVSRKS